MWQRRSWLSAGHSVPSALALDRMRRWRNWYPIGIFSSVIVPPTILNGQYRYKTYIQKIRNRWYFSQETTTIMKGRIETHLTDVVGVSFAGTNVFHFFYRQLSKDVTNTWTFVDDELCFVFFIVFVFEIWRVLKNWRRHRWSDLIGASDTSGCHTRWPRWPFAYLTVRIARNFATLRVKVYKIKSFFSHFLSGSTFLLLQKRWRNIINCLYCL